MFELNIDGFSNFFKYGILASPIFGGFIFLRISFFSPKIFGRGLFIIFSIALILALVFAGTGSMDCLCQREVNNNNIVTCYKNSSLLFGLIKEKSIISPVEGVKLEIVAETPTIYLSSQGKDYLLRKIFLFSNPLSVKKDIENLLAGEGEPVRHYFEGGIIMFIYTIIFVSIASLFLTFFFCLAKSTGFI